MIDRFTEQRIKDTANIFDVVRYYGFTLKKQGSGHVTLCPFHPDRHPSMQVGGRSRYANKCHCYVCGAHHDPVSFAMAFEKLTYPQALRRLADICGMIITDQPTDGEQPPTLPPPPPRPAAQPPTFTAPSVMLATMREYKANPLFSFVSSLFGEQRTAQAFALYHVGTANHKVNPNQGERKSVVFWQVDESGQVRGGKILPYDESTGKRIKDPAGRREAVWTHTAMRTQGYNLQQCLFGQHLITPAKRVNIVESEKTAILAHLYFGDRLGAWIATGGKSAGKTPIFEAASLMDGKDVVLYPDADGQDQWQLLCDELTEIGLKVSVSSVMKAQHIDPSTKKDIGDHIVGLMMSRRTSAPSAPTIDAERPRATATETAPPSPGTAPDDPRPRATATTPPPMSAQPSVDMAPAEPTAPGESEDEARANNAAILAQAQFVADLLRDAYKFEPPSPRDIEILDPWRAAPEFAPF